VLAAVAAAFAAAVPAGTAAAQAQALQPPPAADGGPSLRIETAALGQVGDDLRLRLRLNRPLPVGELDPAKARFACLVLGPRVASRRRVCVSRRAGRLRATLAPIRADGRALGKQLSRVRGARIEVQGRTLVLQASAARLRVKLGRPVTWQAVITWADGGGCVLAPGPGSCTQRVPEAGPSELRTRGPRRPAFTREGRLRLLATGDSMIQIVDSILAHRLERRRGTRVRSDARISTGLSKPFQFDWVRRAREQARSLHPDVTVMFIGANDGFPMKTPGGASVGCCGGPWVTAYARRVEAMMRSYRRRGRSYVYWMTLPAPNRSDFARVYRAVNRAIHRSAARVGRGVRVIDLVPVFTPGGEFRRYVRFRGKRVNARQDDGVHLSVAGAHIAATLLVDRLKADGALQRLR
jgi:lysophospholipase L1-like esterase